MSYTVMSLHWTVHLLGFSLYFYMKLDVHKPQYMGTLHEEIILFPLGKKVFKMCETELAEPLPAMHNFNFF